MTTFMHTLPTMSTSLASRRVGVQSSSFDEHQGQERGSKNGASQF